MKISIQNETLRNQLSDLGVSSVPFKPDHLSDIDVGIDLIIADFSPHVSVSINEEFDKISKRSFCPIILLDLVDRSFVCREDLITGNSEALCHVRINSINMIMGIIGALRGVATITGNLEGVYDHKSAIGIDYDANKILSKKLEYGSIQTREFKEPSKVLHVHPSLFEVRKKLDTLGIPYNTHFDFSSESGRVSIDDVVILCVSPWKEESDTVFRIPSFDIWDGFEGELLFFNKDEPDNLIRDYVVNEPNGKTIALGKVSFKDYFLNSTKEMSKTMVTNTAIQGANANTMINNLLNESDQKEEYHYFFNVGMSDEEVFKKIYELNQIFTRNE